MNNKNSAILVVDDIISSAQDFAALIEANLKLKVAVTSKPDEAIDIIKKNDIRVVVLDQVMPLKSGTDLYKEIKVINPAIKAIMLTGEAASEEVGAAMTLGFSDYLKKGDVLELSGKVLKWYIQYEIDFVKKHDLKEMKPLSFKFNLKRLNLIKYYLVNITPLPKDMLAEEEKEVILDINAGQNIERTENRKVENSIKVESVIERRLQSELDFSIKEIKFLKTKINAILTEKYAQAYMSNVVQTNTYKEKFQLPQQPTDINEKHICRRVMERTPVYKEFRLIIVSKCIFCKNIKTSFTTIQKKTNKYHTCITDYYSDNTQKTTDLGIHKLVD